MNNNTEGNNINNIRTQSGKRTETMKGNTQRNIQRENGVKAQASNQRNTQRRNGTGAQAVNRNAQRRNEAESQAANQRNVQRKNAQRKNSMGVQAANRSTQQSSQTSAKKRNGNSKKTSNKKGNNKKGNNRQRKNKKPRTQKQKIFRVIKYIFLVLFLILLAVGIRYGSIVLKYKSEAEALIEEKGDDAFTDSLTTVVFDADGAELAEFSSDKNSYYLKSEEIPYMAKKIFIAVEDRKFEKHSGVDYVAVARAFVELIKNNGEVTQGGSTITQQLARNVFLTHEVSIERKLKEIFIARKLEKKYSKDQILEYYINGIYFANGFYGLEAAAKGYFQKSAVDLSLSELAFVCSIPNNPTLYDPMTNMENTLKRRDRVLKQIYEQGYITQNTYNEALAEVITLSPDIKSSSNNYVETFIRYSATIELMKERGFIFKNSFSSSAEEEEYDRNYSEVYSECNQLLFTSGYRIYTSIDMGVQELLQNTLDEKLSESQDKSEDGIYKFQGSATCVDNSTGYVVAVVGGRTQNEYKGYTLNRAYQSFRQPGSSIKPILVYTPLFERGYTPSSIVEDEPVKNGPVNAPNVYSGSISLKYAIKTSKNTVAWNCFEDMGYGTCIDYLLKMNFSHIVKDDYTPAMSIGGMTYGASTFEMAAAYATIENQGVFRNPTCIKRIENAFGEVIWSNGSNDKNTKQIYEKKATLMMTDCMKEVLDSGTGRNYKIDTAICAAKTGTTNDDKDTWFVGFSHYYTTAVWCGYDMPQEIEGNLVRSAGNTWHDFMEKLHDSLKIVDFDSYYDEDEDDTRNEEETETTTEETTEDNSTEATTSNEIYTNPEAVTTQEETTTKQKETETETETETTTKNVETSNTEIITSQTSQIITSSERNTEAEENTTLPEQENNE